jgi:hypothetical protein
MGRRRTRNRLPSARPTCSSKAGRRQHHLRQQVRLHAIRRRKSQGFPQSCESPAGCANGGTEVGVGDIFVGYTRSDRAGGEPLDPVRGYRRRETHICVHRPSRHQSDTPTSQDAIRAEATSRTDIQQTLRIAAMPSPLTNLPRGRSPQSKTFGLPDVTSNPQCPDSSNDQVMQAPGGELQLCLRGESLCRAPSSIPG